MHPDPIDPEIFGQVAELMEHIRELSTLGGLDTSALQLLRDMADKMATNQSS